MSRAMTIVLALALGSFALPAQQAASIDKDKLDKIRKMSPEERQKLVERLRQIKRLSAEEQERLNDNLTKLKKLPKEEQHRLQKKVEQLSPVDKKAYTEMAAGFYRDVHNRDPRLLKEFPRGVFFNWLTKEKRDDLDRIRNMDPEDRRGVFARFYFEFQQVAKRRLVTHVRKHKCVPEAELDSLNDLISHDFWPNWQKIVHACPDKQKKNPNPNGQKNK